MSRSIALVAALALVPSMASAQGGPFPFLDVREFGAVGDGLTDDTLAFELAIEAASDTTGAYANSVLGNTIVVPKGRYRISRTLHIDRVHGMKIVGAGLHNTVLVWRDPPSSEGAPVSSLMNRLVIGDEGGGDGDVGELGTVFFEIDNAVGCRFQDLSLIAEDRLEDAFFVVRASSSGVFIKNDLGASFERISMDGGATRVGRAMRFLGERGRHVLRGVSVRRYDEAAFSLEGKGVTEVEFHGCRFEGDSGGLVGVSTRLGTDPITQAPVGGSFRWYGGGGGGNRTADFDLGTPVGTIVIQGGFFSNSARFVNSDGPSSSRWPVILEFNIWRHDFQGGTAPTWPVEERNRVILFQHKGPLRIVGNQLGEAPGIQYQTASPLEVLWNPGGNEGEFIFENNFLATTKANPFEGTTSTGSSIGTYPTVQRGNLIQGSFATNPIPMPAHATTLSGSATPSVGRLSTGRRLFSTGAGPAITELRDGIDGQEIVIRGTGGGRTIRHTATIRLEGGVDRTLLDDDTITLALYPGGTWVEVR